jgi:RND family efflux transporter MFP subunit
MDVQHGEGTHGRKGVHGSFAAILLLFALLYFTGCGEKVTPGHAPVKRPLVSGVSVITVAPSLVDEYSVASGTIKAASVSIIASRIMGAVTSLLVREGTAVQTGQQLLTIDDRDIQEKVKAAEAGYQEALKALDAASQNRELTDITYQRYKNMYDEKAISSQEMDQFATQKRVAGLEHERLQETVKRAAAGLAEAKISLSFTSITAPHQGIVTEKKIEVGSMAVPGQPLLTVENTASFQAEIAVEESLAGKLAVGTPVVVTLESVDRPLEARISQILPTVDPLSHTFTIKIVLNRAGLKSGLYVKATIPKGKKEMLLVPGTAIVEKGQLTGVYAVDDQGVITYRLIRIGRNYGGGSEILSGISRNDRIIVKGVEKAVDGGIMESNKK